MLDLSGLSSLTNEGVYALVVEEKGVELGVLGLKHLRLNGISKITDHPTGKLCCRNRSLETIELCKCTGLTIISIEQIVRSLNNLKILNVNMIPKLNLKPIKDVLEQKPWLQVLQFAAKLADVRDNGLRVPLPQRESSKKQKK